MHYVYRQYYYRTAEWQVYECLGERFLSDVSTNTSQVSIVNFFTHNVASSHWLLGSKELNLQPTYDKLKKSLE